MATFRNPLHPEGADPWIVRHRGAYFLLATEASHISIRYSETLGGLKDALPATIWTDEHPERCKEMWAPELYFWEGRWYLYYTAGDGIDDNHRCYVLESETDNPIGPYAFKAQLDTELDYYAIDTSLLVLADGRLYLLWAGRPDHRLFTAPLENPWTVSGKRVLLEADGFGCEEVREGPVCLVRNGRVFLVYSVCDTGKPDYKLGMLVADQNADLLDPASWKQWPEPVFTRNDAAGVYGPGHNGFFQTDDGQDWIVYHAKTSSEYTYAGRSTRVQPFTWREDGTPDFGVPLSLDTDIEEP
ncbi:beta-xylosidase [bacterium]|nr:MAG: beta-xylosidase [bacterium]